MFGALLVPCFVAGSLRYTLFAFFYTCIFLHALPLLRLRQSQFRNLEQEQRFTAGRRGDPAI